MDKEQYQMAKAHLIACMQQGQTWQQAAASAGLQISQSNVYRLWLAVRQHSETALKDGRHGRPVRLRGEARAFLEDACRKAPYTPSSVIQRLLQVRFGLSVSQINRETRKQKRWRGTLVLCSPVSSCWITSGGGILREIREPSMSILRGFEKNWGMQTRLGG